MAHACHGQGLRTEALALVRPGVAVRPQRLQGYQPVQAELTGLINHAHTASAQLTHDGVAGQRWRGHRSGWRRAVRCGGQGQRGCVRDGLHVVGRLHQGG